MTNGIGRVKLDIRRRGIQANKPIADRESINLINNGIEAMRGGGQLTLQTGLAANLVEIVIGDNGKGIPSEELDTIFEPFFPPRTRGTGLGLSISRSIIEDHGNTIRAESESGKGARFVIRLPVEASQ